MSIRPVRVDLWLIYECEKCKAEHWARAQETSFPGGFLCFCGAKNKFEQIERVSITPKYKKQQEKLVGQTENKNIDYEKAVDNAELRFALEKLGYRTNVAKHLAQKYSAEHLSLNTEQLLEKILYDQRTQTIKP